MENFTIVLLIGIAVIVLLCILCFTTDPSSTTLELFGSDVLGNYNLVICGLVRNSKKTILKNLDVLEEISSHFSKRHFILIENDSIDGTQKLLKKWANGRDYVNLISKKMDSEIESTNFPHPGKKMDYSLSRKRFEKMAVLRNIYMHNLPEYTKALNTWVMVVDLDLKSIPLEDTLVVLNSLIHKQWDAVCANGLFTNPYGYVKRKDNGKMARPYDTLATRFLEDDLDKNFTILDQIQTLDIRKEWNNHQQKVWNVMMKNKDVEEIPVKSCFGGLAIYKGNKFFGRKYSGEDCEHISVHRHLNDIKLLPQFNVYYN